MGLKAADSACVQAAAGYKDGFYCLEYRISYLGGETDCRFFNIDSENAIDVGLQISALPDALRKQMERHKGEIPARGNGKMGPIPAAGSGNMSGGGRPGPRVAGQRRPAMEEETIHLSIELARR